MIIPPSHSEHEPTPGHADRLDPREIQAILDAHGRERSALIAILGDIQTTFRYLPQEALEMVAELTGTPLVEVYAAATFYHSFSLRPKGRHIIVSCQGTACHVRGASRIAEEFQRQLGIGPGETTSDMQFTLETANCLGACALGPVVVVDGRYFSKVKTSQVQQIIEDALDGFDQVAMEQDRRIFPVDASCSACGHSLMDEGLEVDGRPAIRLRVVCNGSSGMLGLSQFYGSDSTIAETRIPLDEVAELVCPHCESPMNGDWTCAACGAPMAALRIRGEGQLHICKRQGCKGRLLDVAGLPPVADRVVR